MTVLRDALAGVQQPLSCSEPHEMVITAFFDLIFVLDSDIGGRLH